MVDRVCLVALVAVTFVLVLEFAAGRAAAFNVSLKLQGGNCSDQLTLICRHSDIDTDPNWIRNGTVEAGQLLTTAFPGLTRYSFQNSTEHRVTVTGVDNVTALDGYVFQCVYSIQGSLIKSNAVQYSFVPNDYHPALSSESYRPDFSKRLSTFTYSFQESCSLYPSCTPYFSVEHTVSPLTDVTNTSSGCTVVYTISNLEMCRTYHSIATAVFGNRRGNSVVVGDSVMLSPAQFNITIVSIGVDRHLINVTYEQIEPDCRGYPTERYTVDIDGVQVANMTADEFQPLTTNHSNGSVTVSLPLTQRLSEEAVTVNMTKFNTVPTNTSDDVGNIVTEMVTWGTSAVFDLQTTPLVPGPASIDTGATIGGTIGVFIAVIIIGGSLLMLIFICICKKDVSWTILAQMLSKPLLILPEDNQPVEAVESGTLQPLQQYAELEFGDREMRPFAAPPNENFDVQYTEISKA